MFVYINQSTFSIEHCGKWPERLEGKGCRFILVYWLSRIIFSCVRCVFVLQSLSLVLCLCLCSPVLCVPLCLTQPLLSVRMLSSNQSAFVYQSVEKDTRELIILCNQVATVTKNGPVRFCWWFKNTTYLPLMHPLVFLVGWEVWVWDWVSISERGRGKEEENDVEEWAVMVLGVTGVYMCVYVHRRINTKKHDNRNKPIDLCLRLSWEKIKNEKHKQKDVPYRAWEKEKRDRKSLGVARNRDTKKRGVG